MKFENKIVSIDEYSISLCICYNLNSDKPNLISIHGAGPAGKERISYITQTLSDNNIGSVTFDFPGHGESSGSLSDSSLAIRTRIAKHVIQEYCCTYNLTIIATSMGGHIASELLPYFNVSSLILFCPASYALEAFDEKFGENFTAIIRAEDSYLNSKAFVNISNYSGRLLLIYGDKDDIIPNKVINNYWSNAKVTSFKRKVELKETPHVIHKWAEKNNNIKNEVLNEVLEFVCNHV